jgi:hypothetical protein
MARPRKIQMDDTEVSTEIETPVEEVTLEVTPEPKSFVVQVEDAVVNTLNEAELELEKAFEFMSEQAKAEIELGRSAMKKFLGL